MLEFQQTEITISVNFKWWQLNKFLTHYIIHPFNMKLPQGMWTRRYPRKHTKLSRLQPRHQDHHRSVAVSGLAQHPGGHSDLVCSLQGRGKRVLQQPRTCYISWCVDKLYSLCLPKSQQMFIVSTANCYTKITSELNLRLHNRNDRAWWGVSFNGHSSDPLLQDLLPRNPNLPPFTGLGQGCEGWGVCDSDSELQANLD